MGFEVKTEIRVEEISSIVSLEDLNVGLELVFNQSMKVLEYVVGPRFFLS